MRPAIAAVVVVLVLAGFRLSQSSTAATVEVKVDLKCTGNGASYTVDPWQVRIKQGDQVEWVLDPGAGTDDIEIRPKQAPRWPFASSNFRGNRPNRPFAREMRPGQRGTYAYDVRMVCKTPVSRPDTIVVDPEVIID